MSPVCSYGAYPVGNDGGEGKPGLRMVVDTPLSRGKLNVLTESKMTFVTGWWMVTLFCIFWNGVHITSHAATPVPPPEAVKQFAAAKQSQDVNAVLAVFRLIGQQDTKEAVIAMTYGGLTESMLDGFSAEQVRQVLATAREVLVRRTDTRAWKATYKATYKHPDWRVRTMLLDVVRTRLPGERRAEKAVVRAIGDPTDAVAIKAIEMAGELNLKRTVPKLMQMVIAKWGQHVGVSAAKATLALEKITGTTTPAGWHAWVNQNL